MSRVCFVSDLHLFADRSRAAEQHGDLLAAARAADTLVLGGDIFDFRWSTHPSPQATADAAIAWLDRLHADLPTQRIRYLLGNHDHAQPLIDALPGFCAAHPRLDWHGSFLRLGQTVFLHGDVADRPMTPETFERRRSRSLHHGRRRRGPLSRAAYRAMLRTRMHEAVPRVVYPRRVAARRILHYLDQIGQRHGVRDVYYGHTHRAIEGFRHRGVTFHNAGAPIGDQPLRCLRADVADDVVAAG